MLQACTSRRRTRRITRASKRVPVIGGELRCPNVIRRWTTGRSCATTGGRGHSGGHNRAFPQRRRYQDERAHQIAVLAAGSGGIQDLDVSDVRAVVGPTPIFVPDTGQRFSIGATSEPFKTSFPAVWSILAFGSLNSLADGAASSATSGSGHRQDRQPPFSDATSTRVLSRGSPV